MGQCLCTRAPNFEQQLSSNVFDHNQRTKSCGYWDSDNTLAVCGFIHEYTTEHEDDLCDLKWPRDITKLIIEFYGQQYQIVGIGRNGDGELGLGHNEEVNKFNVLPQFERLVDSPSDVYFGMSRYLVKNVFNEIYSAGTNLYGAAGLENQNSLSSITDDDYYDDDTQRITTFMKILNSTEEYIDIISSGICFNAYNVRDHKRQCICFRYI